MSRIGNIHDFADNSTTSLSGESGDLLIFKRAEEVFIYQNKCPHTQETLDPQGGSLASADGLLLTCQRHGAQFLSHNGVCVGGPCQGESLPAVAFTLSNTDIYLD
jgi:nitrite reductase/ring-hydroxylating ferredoxin subunit